MLRGVQDSDLLNIKVAELQQTGRPHCSCCASFSTKRKLLRADVKTVFLSGSRLDRTTAKLPEDCSLVRPEGFT